MQFFEKLPKGNNRSMGENSPNLVTLQCLHSTRLPNAPERASYLHC
jgi:hypothetical protein